MVAHGVSPFRHPRWHAGTDTVLRAECEHRVLQPTTAPVRAGNSVLAASAAFPIGLRRACDDALAFWRTARRRCRCLDAVLQHRRRQGDIEDNAGRCSRAVPNKASVRPIISVVGGRQGFAPRSRSMSSIASGAVSGVVICLALVTNCVVTRRGSVGSDRPQHRRPKRVRGEHDRPYGVPHPCSSHRQGCWYRGAPLSDEIAIDLLAIQAPLHRSKTTDREHRMAWGRGAGGISTVMATLSPSGRSSGFKQLQVLAWRTA